MHTSDRVDLNPVRCLHLLQVLIVYIRHSVPRDRRNAAILTRRASGGSICDTRGALPPTRQTEGGVDGVLRCCNYSRWCTKSLKLKLRQGGHGRPAGAVHKAAVESLVGRLSACDVGGMTVDACVTRRRTLYR